MEIVHGLNDNIAPLERAVALGFFDGVHLGHAAVLSRAAEYRNSGYVPCAFTFLMDESTRPKGKKNSLSIQTEEEKMECMKELGIEQVFCPDFTSFMNLSPEEFAEDVLVKKFNAKVLCCGSDFRFGKYASGDIDFLKSVCEKHGIKLDIVDKVYYEGEPVSSTRIRQAIADGKMDLVSGMMGRYYTITSEVIHGRQLGRKIGFPTVNQRIPKFHSVPKFGVYATFVTLENGETYCGTTNVGVKPTVGSDEILAEGYILNFDKSIYGQIIRTEFVEFLRGEEKFDSVEALSRAIARDSQKSWEIFKKSYRKEGN